MNSYHFIHLGKSYMFIAKRQLLERKLISMYESQS